MRSKRTEIYVLASLVASLMSIVGAYALQIQQVRLELNDKDAMFWVDNEFRRKERIEQLEKKAKILMFVGIGLLVGPVAYEAKMEWEEINEEARIRELKRRRSRRSKTK